MYLPITALSDNCSSMPALGTTSVVCVNFRAYIKHCPNTLFRCTKGRGMCYPVCEVVHIKEPLLVIGKSSPCSGASGFHL